MTIDEITIFPQPQEIHSQPGEFTINAHTRIFAEDSALGEMLSRYLQPATGFGLPVHPLNDDIAAEAQNAVLLTPSNDNVGSEAYALIVEPGRAMISAAERRGFLQGMQTLRQLLPAEILASDVVEGVDWTMPCVRISDSPAFAWRGVHLDVGRHLFPVAFIKKFIDMLAFHKFNTFHWHLTEDQGWRIEIKKYPRLTEVGGFRAETVVAGAWDEYDGAPYGGFYTQDEVREVVAYAGERGITVMPEIELPGHAVAALTAYPELGCVGEGYAVRTTWGIAEDIFCAGKDAVFSFLKDVLSETLELFPSEYIHIGGDEAPKARWSSCPACQARIQAEGLADEHELQSWFIREIEGWLNERGRKLVGWDEILEGGLSPSATVMSWRGSDGGIAAANAGNDVIMTPNTYCYMDYYQSEDTDSEPPAIPAILPLRQVWDYVVVPEQIAEDKRRHIIGGQANIWTEFMPNGDHVEYMMFPRAVAIADVLWRHPAERDYEALAARLGRHLPRLDAMGVNYRPLDD